MVLTMNVQESSNIGVQVQVGSGDVQVQNSDIVTDQSATSDGEDNSVSQSIHKMILLNLNLLLEMLLKAKILVSVQLNLLYQLAITIANLNLLALQWFKANLQTN